MTILLKVSDSQRVFKNTNLEEFKDYHILNAVYAKDVLLTNLRMEVLGIREFFKNNSYLSHQNAEYMVDKLLTKDMRQHRETMGLSVPKLENWQNMLQEVKSEYCHRCRCWVDYPIYGLCDDCKKEVKIFNKVDE